MFLQCARVSILRAEQENGYLEAQVAEYLAFLERFRAALQREEHS